MSYLCTIMNQPGIEDTKKLNMVLRFMNWKINNERVIGANKLHKMKTYTDSSHAMQMDMRVHTGGVSNFDIGVLTAKSSKHKINFISSNEYEIMGNI